MFAFTTKKIQKAPTHTLKSQVKTYFYNTFKILVNIKVLHNKTAMQAGINSTVTIKITLH